MARKTPLTIQVTRELRDHLDYISEATGISANAVAVIHLTAALDLEQPAGATQGAGNTPENRSIEDLSSDEVKELLALPNLDLAQLAENETATKEDPDVG